MSECQGELFEGQPRDHAHDPAGCGWCQMLDDLPGPRPAPDRLDLVALEVDQARRLRHLVSLRGLDVYEL